MSRRAQKITVTTVGTPPLEGAEVFAKWMAAVLNKQTDPGPDKPNVKPAKAARQDGQENS